MRTSLYTVMCKLADTFFANNKRPQQSMDELAADFTNGLSESERIWAEHYSDLWEATVAMERTHPSTYDGVIVPGTRIDIDNELTPDGLRMKYNEDQHPKFPKMGWFNEVAQGSTVRGYWDWVAAQIEESINDTFTDNSPALYIKVEGGVVQAVAVRGIDLGEKQLQVIVDDLDSAEEDGRPDLIAFNGGEVPKEFVFIW